MYVTSRPPLPSNLQMHNVFISYRRNDNDFAVQALRDALLRQLGKPAIFLDVYDISLGEDYRKKIVTAIRECSVTLVIIGPSWLDVRDENGRRRLESADDFVRFEIQTALSTDTTVIPVLIGNAVMPTEQQLPADIADLAKRNAALLRANTDFEHDLEQLLLRLNEFVPTGSTAATNPETHSLDKNEKRHLTKLCQNVQRFWIDGYLDHSLRAGSSMKVGRVVERTGIEHPWQSIVEVPESDVADQLNEQPIIEIFDELSRHLLILGEPGAGKTISLLELTRALIERTGNDTSFATPVPVIFNLASWSERQLPLTEWMVEELSQKYHVPRRVGKDWVDSSRITPLLDGLDEVRSDARAECVQAINDFSDSSAFSGLVVCCRTEEYNDLGIQLQLDGAVSLRPLSARQITTYLESFGDDTKELRRAIQADSALQDLASSPLLLHIMELINANGVVLRANEATNREAALQKLFDAYTEHAFRRKGKTECGFDRTEITDQLTWLARNMKEQSRSDFLIEQLQPNWLTSRVSRCKYLIASRVAITTIWSTIGGCTLLVAYWLSAGLYHGIKKTGHWTWFNIGEQHESWTFAVGGILAGLIAGIIECLRLSARPRHTTGFKAYALPFAVHFITILAASTMLIVFLLQIAVDKEVDNNTAARIAEFTQLAGAANVSNDEALRMALVNWGVPPAEAATATIESWSTMRRQHVRRFATERAFYGAAMIASFCAVLFGIRSTNRPLSRDIQTTELLKWSRRGTRRGVVHGLIWGTVLSFIVHASNWLLFASTSIPFFSLQALKHLGIGSVFGTLLGAAVGLVIGGLEGTFIKGKMVPNQGIKLSIRSAVKFTWMSWLLLPFVVLPVSILQAMQNEDFAIVVWSTAQTALGFAGLIGIGFGMWFGGADVIKHFILRILLWRQGSMPLRIDRLLDEAARVVLLRRVGGGYIFVHRLLLEHFAAMGVQRSDTKYHRGLPAAKP